MANLDRTKISRLLFFERLGHIATAFCAFDCIAFAVLFAVAQTQDIATLRIISLTAPPVLLVLGIAAAAYIDFRYGGELKDEIDGYVRAVLIENAALLHPEKNELLFTVATDDTGVELKVNNYKETIKFDFSAFKKLSLTRKSAVANAVCDRLTATYCKLYEQGASYANVSYCAANSSKKRAVFIIKDGEPDKRAFRQYLKTKK